MISSKNADVIKSLIPKHLSVIKKSVAARDKLRHKNSSQDSTDYGDILNSRNFGPRSIKTQKQISVSSYEH